MTVNKLIEKLKEFDGEKKIKFELLTEFGFHEGHDMGSKTKIDLKNDKNEDQIIIRLVYGKQKKKK